MDTLLNEYEMLGKLGEGSFAKIYKVRHLELDYIRAIRVLNEIVIAKDKSYQTFLKECKVLLQLGNGGHPNIVRIYQPRLLQNHALVEMDYIDGSDLNDYLNKQNKFVPINEVMRFIREIGSALSYCHVDCYEFLYDRNKEYEYKLESGLKGQKFKIVPDPDNGNKDFITDLQRLELIREYGITHNDLHSKNIMRKRYDGSYILLDFGLAIQDGMAVKSSSRRDGAVEYKAPEKWNKDSVISEKTDIYSFGILMYEMLAGQVPFPFQREKYSNEEQALFELSMEHENQPPPAIEPLRRLAFESSHPGETYQKDYPDRLEKMILKCLEKKPENRYANAKEFYEAFKILDKPDNTADNEEITRLKTQIINHERHIERLKEREEYLEQQIRIYEPSPRINVQLEKMEDWLEVKNLQEKFIRKTKKIIPVLIGLCLILSLASGYYSIKYYKYPKDKNSASQQKIETMQQQLKDKDNTITALKAALGVRNTQIIQNKNR